MIEINKVYKRGDGIYRRVLKIITDDHMPGGQRVEFEYWNPENMKREMDRGSCGITTFQEFSVEEIIW